MAQIKNLKRPFDEIIFYNDASTDKTEKILLQNGYRVISGVSNMGPGHARNRLAKAAKEEYIHFHDVDDEFNTEFLNLVIERMRFKKPDMILGNADWIDESSRKPLIKWTYNEVEISKNPLAYFINNPLGIINTIYKREIFLKINGFNEEIKCWEDADLNIRMAASEASIMVIEKTLAYSIRHNNGISRDQDWCWDCRLKFIKTYLKNYLEQLSPEIFVQEFKRIQNAYILSGHIHKLNEIISLNKQYDLKINVKKIKVLYNLDKFIPEYLMSSMLKIYFKLNRL